MTLPDGLTDAQLAEHGFTKVSESKAEHERYSSSRHRCEQCRLWFKQVASRQGKMLCRRCGKVD